MISITHRYTNMYEIRINQAITKVFVAQKILQFPQFLNHKENISVHFCYFG